MSSLMKESLAIFSEYRRRDQDFSKCQASEFLLPNEAITFSMVPTKEEFTFTSMALIKLEGENSTTTCKLV